MSKIILNGITWGHSRGITPLLAAAQRFSELHPEVEINWKKRTLQEFADFPIEKLTESYDLLIIDHPWVGCANAKRCVLPLEEYLSAEYLKDQQEHTVGYSHLSYNYGGHQWALAIDAATPVASYRPDLLAKNNASVPTTWAEVIALAKEGKVAVPAIPIDQLMNFYMFCIANGKEPFQTEEEIIDKETGLKALATMTELYSVIDKQMFGWNPIATAEAMTKTDNYWYCPFAYGYPNYSRKGFAANTLQYDDLVFFKEGQRLRSTIGGTGLAVSAFSENKDWAVKFAEYVVSPMHQATMYVEHGGLPGHRLAWESEANNRLTNNYFNNTLPTMQNGFVRPRYNGYLHFQDHGGDPLHEYLKNGGNPEETLRQMNEIYHKSLAIKNA